MDKGMLCANAFSLRAYAERIVPASVSNLGASSSVTDFDGMPLANLKPENVYLVHT